MIFIMSHSCSVAVVLVVLPARHRESGRQLAHAFHQFHQEGSRLNFLALPNNIQRAAFQINAR